MLATIETFRKTRFAPGSAPDPRTLRKLLERGDLPGRRVGKVWYVDTGAWERGEGGAASVEGLVARALA